MPKAYLNMTIQRHKFLSEIRSESKQVCLDDVKAPNEDEMEIGPTSYGQQEQFEQAGNGGGET